MDAARDYEHLSELDLAQRAYARDPQAIRLITTRNNQRLYRAAWSVLRNRADAEEAVQDAYVKAFSSARFEGRSSLATWLTRITLNEALMRKRANEARKRSLAKADVAPGTNLRFVESPARALPFREQSRMKHRRDS